jgi:hypothetical protein
MLQAVVGELDTPEIPCGVKHFKAELEDAGCLRPAYPDYAKFLDFLGQAIQDFDAGTKDGFKCAANQRPIPADGDGLREAIHGFAMNIIGEELNGNPNQDAARAAPLDHCAGTGHCGCASLTNLEAGVKMVKPHNLPQAVPKWRNWQTR